VFQLVDDADRRQEYPRESLGGRRGVVSTSGHAHIFYASKIETGRSNQTMNPFEVNTVIFSVVEAASGDSTSLTLLPLVSKAFHEMVTGYAVKYNQGQRFAFDKIPRVNFRYHEMFRRGLGMLEYLWLTEYLGSDDLYLIRCIVDYADYRELDWAFTRGLITRGQRLAAVERLRLIG
jgi:hypothetical protein